MIRIRKTLIVFSVAFFTYLIAAFLQANGSANIIACVTDVLATVTIFYSVFKSDNSKFRASFIIAGLAVLSWTAADFLWTFYAALNMNPDSSQFISLFYFGTNVFIFISILHYCVCRIRSWDFAQLITDAVFITMAVLWLIWVLFFDKDYESLAMLMKDSVINGLSVAIDICQAVVITVFLLSIRKGAITVPLALLSGSCFIYSIVDLVYFYLYMKELYIPNTLIDSLYLVTVIGVVIAARLYYTNYPQRNSFEDPNSNVGYQHRGLVLMFAPVLTILFKGLDFVDLGVFILLIFMQEGFSRYIQASIRNKKLLEREVNLNHELEIRISERTRDLENKNNELRWKNAELEYITDHDSLTGLYNRKYFLKELEEKIRNKEPGKKIAMILWNIDRLKNINDTYGHAAGDRIIMVLAHRVSNINEESALLARMGGDEFVFAFEGYFHNDEFVDMAKHIAALCTEPIEIGEYTFHITISAGVSLYPSSAYNAEMLLKNSDVALQHAKESRSGNSISLYQEIDPAIKRRDLVANTLKGVDYDKEFILYFQPQFRTYDKKLIGMEALLRWKSPQLGFVSPAEFIPIAEEQNLIVPIGNWVIENAIRQISYWNRTYNTSLKMGINISPKQMNQADILEIMKSSLSRHEATAAWLDIEITEGVALDSEDKAAKLKQNFLEQGISISIDDFGTGYSSLGYLNMLSFDRLKIAKPLIDKITYDECSAKIVSSIIMLAKSLGIQTLSEGVETKDQFDLLHDLGCDQIQGFYLGIPLPPESFQYKFLKNNHDDPGSLYFLTADVL